MLTDLEPHREALFRYALLQTRDASMAEDLVQATFLAALQSAGGFRGDSSPRTWLIGILRRKIVDQFRAGQQAAVPLQDATRIEGELADTEIMDRLFSRNGTWEERRQAWSDPDSALEQEDFWSTFEACLKAVPGTAGRAFVLRELVGLEAEEICKNLRISRSNYWVLMHRARLRLGDCLDKRWFMGERLGKS